MRIALILGHQHGSDQVEIVSVGSPDDMNNKFKEMILAGAGTGEIYLHEFSLSSGRKRHTFKPQKTVSAHPVDETDETLPVLLETLTVDELKQLAEDEDVDVSGCKLKKDFVETIVAHRAATSES